MKVLYVGSKVPFPVLDGGCFAMMRFIESMKETNWCIDALLFTTQKHPYTKESKNHLDTFFNSTNTVAINTEVKPLAALWNYILRKNYNLKRFKTAEVFEILNQYLSTSYDLVIFDSLFAAAFLPQLKQKYQSKFIIRAHNVEHEIWRTLANEEKSKLKKKYLVALSKTLQQEEFTILNAADQIWTMSEEDSELLKQKAISTPIKYIPVAIEVAKIKTDLSQTNCFHIGSMNWQPNIEAVNYLIDQLWLKKPNLPNLTIAGSHSETINSQRFPNNVLIAGRVPDVNAFMSNAGVLVSPIKSGSGIRIKLLEALALGVPCITTKLGAAGINSEEAGVLLAETPEEWELQIQLLTSSIKLREENSQKSIAYILNKHSFANCKLLIETALEG